MSNNKVDEYFKNLPIGIVSPVSMDNPNEPIQIYSGEFKLKLADKEYEVDGNIFFKWYPDMGVKFKATFLNSQVSPFNSEDEFEILVKDQPIGKIKITDLNYLDEPICGGYANRFVWGEGNIPVTEVTFAIPNMREFFGEPIKMTTAAGQGMRASRLTLDDKPYKIVLDKYSDYNERLNKLDEHGGYLITYAGKIMKHKGSISLEDLQKWHDRFYHFLYFLNGRRIAPMFYAGSFDGQNVWTDYSTYYTVDSHKVVPCWSDVMYLNDLPDLWKTYNKLWKVENNQDFLITAIHWYVEANANAGMVEGSIILIQTALELIYNWLIVEKQKIIIGGDAEGLTAANKIRLIISQFKIKAEIPPAFAELATSFPNVKDGPEAFTKIRNALVHGQEAKRSELKGIKLKAKYQALQLGIWYVELSLLYILGYKGKYRNRTSGKIWRDTGTLVPWVNDKTYKVGKPSDFTDDEISTFLELLEKQNKVNDPSEQKIKRCKLIAIGYSWEKPVAIGAIKPKTASDFTAAKANLPDLAKDYDWEVGYFYTEPAFEGRRFSSALLSQLLTKYGDGNLMATTEIREGNRMVDSLEHRRFRQVGATWKSAISNNDLRLFLREKQALSPNLFQFTDEDFE
ncbi:MAG: hypothetical protein V4619_05495 [Bacteroidota bacterium]|jgi:hypothetical protein|uniref:hypothetical protein n=1 Tax=Mucilaginibacter lappiensis TaxID=354630 RepID=UPI00334AC14E